MEKESTLIKKDTAVNWSKAKNFIPKKDEVIVYTDIWPIGVKIGDGITKLNNLDFLNTEYIVEDDVLIINTHAQGGDQ